MSPDCIDVALIIVSPCLHSCCSAVTVLKCPVALKNLYLFRTHHAQDRHPDCKGKSILAECFFRQFLYQVNWAEP